jgi:hypothetical protein
VYKEHICPCKAQDKSYSKKDVMEKAKSLIRQLQRTLFGREVNNLRSAFCKELKKATE